MAEHIKRRDALKVLEQMETIEDGLDAMHNLPAADVVEVVRGKWEDVALSFATVKEKCSICGKIVWEHGLNYCPNCGAKMDGGADHED